MLVEEYYFLKKSIIDIGFKHDLNYIEDRLASPCDNEDNFIKEYVWVVVNSGMRYQIASKIYYKIIEGIKHNIPLEYIFNHESKVNAIQSVNDDKSKIFKTFLNIDDKIQYLETLPWIGPITKFHLGRNLGINVCKPDRHLVRIANKYKTTPHKLCSNLSISSGDLIGVVDFVLWSSGNQKFI